MIWSVLISTLALATSGASPETPDVIVLSESAQTAVLCAHYAKAADELDAVDVGALTADQRAERKRLIGVLRTFAARAEFNRDPISVGARVPYFRDADGLRCAVAELMHASGEDAFVDKVYAERNHVWMCDLRGDPHFEAWLSRSGLTIEEAARIQGPPHMGVTSGQARAANLYPNGYRGPGDTTPSGGSGTGGGRGSGSPSTPSSPSGPTTKGGGGGGSSTPTGGSSSPGQGNAPQPVTLTMTNDDTWWLWWEYNKSEFLLPNRLSLSNAPMTGDDPDAALRTAIGRSRDMMLPVFEHALQDTDANVRATAAVAIGRVEGSAAVTPLLKLLDDPNVDVRHKAILALGATGSTDAIAPLVAIARTGSTGADMPGRISPQAQALAIVALGLARRNAIDDRIDVEIEKVLQNRVKSDREPVGVAALVYQMLAPNDQLKRYAMSMALDNTESPSVRCRAVESMRTSSDDKTLAELESFLNGPRLDLRRSAALALGDYDNSLALPALMVAFDVEAESLTKGFMLIAIGRQGGEKAQDYLMTVLEKGETGMRRWAALGLGLDARKVTDPERLAKLSAAIREASAREKNADSFGAYWLASGLARDSLALPAIGEGLTKCGNQRQRMYAASALALMDGDDALALLRSSMKTESQSLVRVAITQSLGVLGRTADVGMMLDTLLRLEDPDLQGFVAAAMAAHGSPEALHALVEIAQLNSGSKVRRAAALEGLGMMLSPYAPMSFAEVSREANYTVFSDWVNGIFQTTL